MWPWRVKMPTQNLLRLLLMLMLILRIMLATVCYRFGSWRLVLKLNFCSDFEHKGWSRFWSWSSGKIWSCSLFSILPLMFCRGYEVKSWSRFWILSCVEMLMFGWDFQLMLSRDSEDKIWSRFVFELSIRPQEVTLVRWTQSSGPLCLWQCLGNIWLHWNIVVAKIFCLLGGFWGNK